MSDRIELVGVGGGSRSAGELATAAEVPDLGLDDLADRSDALVVAVPPASMPDVIREVAGRVRALLVEAPVPVNLPDPGCPAMLGANFLHAPVVRGALRTIAAMESPHHLILRSTQPAPTWGSHRTPAFGGAGLDPGGRLAPLLFAATGETVESAHAQITEEPESGVENEASFAFTLPSGRTARLESVWAPGSARGELEVASDLEVALLSLFPEPMLEVNGTPVATEPCHPLLALGFIPQLERLSGVVDGSATTWLDLGAGEAICGLLASAVDSARER